MLQDDLLAIERGLWTNNAALYSDSLIEDALLVFPETGIIDRDFAVEAIRRENAEGRRWADVAFADVRTLRASDAAAMLTYKVTARWEGESEMITALASSLYVRRGTSWKLAFHQQTPVSGN